MEDEHPLERLEPFMSPRERCQEVVFHLEDGYRQCKLPAYAGLHFCKNHFLKRVANGRS